MNDYDGRGGIHYMRWRYGIKAKLGQRVRLNMPLVPSLHGKTGTLTGADSHMIVKPDEPQSNKRYRWHVHPLELEYL